MVCRYMSLSLNVSFPPWEVQFLFCVFSLSGGRKQAEVKLLVFFFDNRPINVCTCAVQTNISFPLFFITNFVSYIALCSCGSCLRWAGFAIVETDYLTAVQMVYCFLPIVSWSAGISSELIRSVFVGLRCMTFNAIYNIHLLGTGLNDEFPTPHLRVEPNFCLTSNVINKKFSVQMEKSNTRSLDVFILVDDVHSNKGGTYTVELKKAVSYRLDFVFSLRLIGIFCLVKMKLLRSSVTLMWCLRIPAFCF